MRKAKLVGQMDSVASTRAITCSGPFAHCIQSQDGRFFKWRGKECAGGMRLMMLGENVALVIRLLQSLIQLTL